MALRALCLLAAVAAPIIATPTPAQQPQPERVHERIEARQTGSNPSYCVGMDYPCTKGIFVLGARGGDPNVTDPTSVTPLYGDLQGMEDMAIPLIQKYGGYCRGLPYAAANFPFYGNSVDIGTVKAQTIIKNYVDQCGPSSRIVLLGFSEGAQALTNAMIGEIPAVTPIGMILPLPQKYWGNIKGVALFGNPVSRHGYSPIDYGNATTDGPIALNPISYSMWNSQWGNKVRNYCTAGDASCANGGINDAAVAIHLGALKFWKDNAIAYLMSKLG